MRHQAAPSRLRALGLAALAVGVCALACAPARAQLIKKSESMEQLQGVGIVERRGETLPAGLVVTDSGGDSVEVSEFFDGERPVLLVMAYYDCPMLCTLVLNALQDALNGVKWTAGDEFRVVTISFDHTNTTEMARQRQQMYLAGYDREDITEDAWTFHTADASTARAISDAVGFSYRYLAESGEFSHPAALIFLTPDGQVHNYLENIEYAPRDVKLALLEASQGKQGSIFDRVQHFCFVYDPDKGHYVFAMGLMRTGGLVTMLALGSFVSLMVWRGAARRRAMDLQTESTLATKGAG